MSRLSVVLTIILGFCFYPLMGMNSWFPWSKKPSKDYYLSEDIKKLMLFKAKANFENLSIIIPEEIKNKIATDAYKLYCNELLENADDNKDDSYYILTRKELMQNHKEFMQNHVNNFDFMTMNDKGRESFYILMNKPSGKFSPEEHNDIIKLPLKVKLNARSKVISINMNFEPKKGSFDSYVAEFGGGKVVFGEAIGGIIGILSLARSFEVISLYDLCKEFFTMEAPILMMCPIGWGIFGGFIGDVLTDKRRDVQKSIFTQEEQKIIEVVSKKQIKRHVKKSTKLLSKAVTLDSIKSKTITPFESIEFKNRE